MSIIESMEAMNNFKALNLRNFNDSNDISIFEAPIAFRQGFSSESLKNNKPTLLDLTVMDNQVNLKEYLSLSIEDRKDLDTLKSKFPELDEIKVMHLWNMSDSDFFIISFLLSQLTRVIVENDIKSGRFTPEQIIQESFKYGKENKKFIGIAATVGLLAPESLYQVNKDLAKDIISFIEKKFEKQSNKTNDLKNHFNEIIKDSLSVIDGSKNQSQKDAKLLDNFINQKVKTVDKSNYVALASSLNFQPNVIETLKVVQQVSDELLVKLDCDNSNKGIEHKNYIKNTNKLLFNMIDSCHMVQDLLSNKESKDEYYRALNDSIGRYQEGLIGIVNELHEESLSLLSGNKKTIKSMTR